MDIVISVTLPASVVQLARSLTQKSNFADQLALAALVVKHNEDLMRLARASKALSKVYEENSRDISALRESGSAQLFLGDVASSYAEGVEQLEILTQRTPTLAQSIALLGGGINEHAELIPVLLASYRQEGNPQTLDQNHAQNMVTGKGRPRAPYSRKRVLWGIRGMFDRRDIPVSLNTWPGSGAGGYLEIASAVFQAGGVQLSTDAIKTIALRAGIQDAPKREVDKYWWSACFPVLFLPKAFGWNSQVDREDSGTGYTLRQTLTAPTEQKY